MKVDVPVSDLLAETLPLIQTSIPATIRLMEDWHPLPDRVHVDVAQIKSVLLNLISNAVDAIGANQGTIQIELRHEWAEPGMDHAVLGVPAPGAYVRLSVRDSGSGIPDNVIARIFDPFFSTKEVGKGTGLGLSMVHGIIQQHGGGISLTSSPAAGTSFDLFLPVVAN
jgi:signal transduction histidine kinase